MPWGAIIGGALSAGAGLLGGSESDEIGNQLKKGGRTLKKLTKELKQGSASGYPLRDVFGTQPDFIPYTPVDLNAEQLARIQGNVGALPALTDQVLGGNALNTLSGQLRFSDLVPRGLQALQSLGSSAADLSRGYLPFDDAMQVVRDRAGMAQRLGLAGTQAGSALPRDLGISRLQAMQTGGNMLAQATALADQIDPVSRQILPQSSFFTPQYGVETGIRQGLLNQQSGQGAAMFAAAPDPIAQGVWNFDLMSNLARMGQATAAAAAAPNNALNYQMIGQGLGELGSGIGALFSQPQQAQTGMASATPAFNPFSGLSSGLGSAFSGIGSGIGSAASGFGNFLGGLF